MRNEITAILRGIAHDVVRFVREPAAEWAVRRDLGKTRKQTAFLRNGPEFVDPKRGPSVLVVLLGAMIYDTKLQMVLSNALRLHAAADITVLVEGDHSGSIKRYCRAFGIDDFIQLTDIRVTDDEVERCHQEARRMLAEPMDFPSVKSWTYRDAWIGPQILASVSRANLLGTPDPADPAVAEEIRRMLPDILVSVERANRLVERARPDLMLLIEANYVIFGVLVDTAVNRGCDVIQVTQPWRDDAYMMKRITPRTRRTHPSSLDAESLELIRSRDWGATEEKIVEQEYASRYSGTWKLQSRNQSDAVRELSREELVASVGLDAEKPVAVVFSHLLWDANLFYGEDLFDDYGHWLRETVRAACRNDRLNWLIKLHPANLWKRARAGFEGEYAELTVLDDLLPLPTHVHLLLPDTEVSTLSLYQHADVGITVRGTPGMEMACFGKPVVTAGTGRYSGLGFTVDPQSREEYLAILRGDVAEFDGLDDEQAQLARQHAFGVFFLRPWRTTSFDARLDFTRGAAGPLDQNLTLVANTSSAFAEARDLKKFSDWVVLSDGVDYLDLDRWNRLKEPAMPTSVQEGASAWEVN